MVEHFGGNTQINVSESGCEKVHISVVSVFCLWMQLAWWQAVITAAAAYL